MKRIIKLTVALTVSSLAMTPMLQGHQSLLSAQAIEEQQQPQREISLGASLSQQEIEQTKALLGTSNQPLNQTIMVDGLTIDKYLHIGSDQSTGVYSSGLIETLPKGSGVQVQIVTPHNIQYVKPMTYQNAAITSGAKDVLIKIASVKPVTGEGALAGIYALLEKAGMKVDHKAIQVAEKEIQVVEQAKKEAPVTDAQVNKIIVEIKKDVSQKTVNNQEVNVDQIVQTVIQNNQNIQLSAETIEVLKQVAQDYAQTESAKNKDTGKQLDNSIQVDGDKPYAVDINQFGGLVTFNREGANIPQTIQVSSKDNLVYVDENLSVYKANIEQIPTKEVMAIGQDNSTRQVKVNTAIHLSDPQGNEQMNEEEMYVFFNKEGQLSLLIPNYAENGDPEGMLEYQLTSNPTPTNPEEVDLEKYPYMVDINQLGSQAIFSLEGMNIPTELVLNMDRWDLQYKYSDSEQEQSFVEINQVPTQEISVFSADGSGKRQVKVNTVIRSKQGSENLYLFTNNQGGISLATPNYAGNVEDADKDIMLEYILTDKVEASESTDTSETSETLTETSKPQQTSDSETTQSESPVTDTSNSDELVTTLEETSTVEESPATETTVESSIGEESTSLEETFEETVGSMEETTMTEDIQDETTLQEGSEEAHPNSEEHPYMVDPEMLVEPTSFYLKGINVPNNIMLDLDENTIDFDFSPELQKHGQVTIQQIPTKEISVTSHDGSGVRNVKVNTEIQVTNIEGEEDQILYLFVNAQGDLSLATPNYAGNVDESQKDVMLEYLVGNYDVQTDQVTQP